MSKKVYLTPVKVEIDVIKEFPDADLGWIEPLEHWKFYKMQTCNEWELFAEYCGPDEEHEEVLLVWYNSEKTWGCLEMNPKIFELQGDIWVRKDHG